jgi:kynurenine formamidase
VDEEGLGALRYRLAEEVSEAEVASVVGDVSSPEDAKKIIGKCVERFGRIDVLVANAGVIPLSTKEGKPGMSPFVTSDHIVAFEEKHGALKEGEVVLLQTSWNRYYVEGEEGLKYMHRSLVTMDAPGWPAPAPEMILYLHEKGVKTVGIDAPSIGSAHDPIPVHQEGLSRGMRYVEVLTNFGELPVRGAYFAFLPLKIAGSSGSPGRAIALLPG